MKTNVSVLNGIFYFPCESEADGDLLEAQRKRKIVRILNIVGTVFLLEVVVGYFSIGLFVYFLVLM